MLRSLGRFLGLLRSIYDRDISFYWGGYLLRIFGCI